jgi:hypothetical protein
MIKTLLRVEESDILTKGRDKAFIEVLCKWEMLPWIKYLREHGEIVHVEILKESETYSDTYKLMWKLDPKRETFFYLKYSDDYNNIKRLT